MSENEHSKNTPCNRFEKHGIAILEKGLELEEHYRQCEHCIKAQQAYHALAKIISKTPVSQPTPGWQDAVLDEIRKQNTSTTSAATPKKLLSPFFGAVAASVAAIAITIVLLSDSRVKQAPLNTLEIEQLQLRLLSSGELYRGEQAKIGDRLSIRIRLNQPESAALRVYRDNQLYYSCGQSQSCNIEEQSLVQSPELSAYGEYKTVVFLDKRFANVPSEDIDNDVLAAIDAGSKVILSETIVVR